VTPAKKIPVILLPGGVIPAALAYADLVKALGPEADAHPKELEIYQRTRSLRALWDRAAGKP